MQGKALEIVSKYKLTDANNKLAWSDLEAYYENKRRLINTHLTDLFNVKQMKAETSEALSKLMKEIDTPLDSLKALGRPVDQWSDIIVFLATNRFDENTLRDWQRFLGNSVEPSTREELKKFVESHLLYLEALESSVKSSHKQKEHSRTANTQGKQSSSASHQSQESKDYTKNTGSCAFCSQDHFIAKCNKFQELSQTFDNPERGKFIESNKLCAKCFMRHENDRKCKSKNSCSICKRPHHTLLHYRKPQNSVQASTGD